MSQRPKYKASWGIEPKLSGQNLTDWEIMSTDQPPNNDPCDKDDSSWIDSLTGDMKNINKTHSADITFSTATRDQYLSILATYRSSLNDQLQKIKQLETLGNVGTLDSANQTKDNLQTDVTGNKGIEEFVNKYLDYLDEFEQSIKTAADRLIQHG